MNQSIILKASEYLSGNEDVVEMILAIAKHPNQDDLIDYIDDVTACEKMEYTFTCKEFLKLIGYEETSNLTQFSQKNLNVIENFILHYTQGVEPLHSEMLQSAREYIDEDHVDGENSEEALAEKAEIKVQDNLIDCLKVVASNPEFTKQFEEKFGKLDENGVEHISMLIRNDCIKPKAKKLLLKLGTSK